MATQPQPVVYSTASTVFGVLVGGVVGYALANWDDRRHKALFKEPYYSAAAVGTFGLLGGIFGRSMSAAPNPAYLGSSPNPPPPPTANP